MGRIADVYIGTHQLHFTGYSSNAYGYIGTLRLVFFFFFTSLIANKTMIVQFCDLTSQCVIISTLNIYDCFCFLCLVTHSFKSYFMIKVTFLRTESTCGIILLTFNTLGCFQLINCEQICALVFHRRHEIS